MMLKRSKLLRAAAVAAMSGTLALVPASAAQAAAYGDYTASGIRIRACAKTTCTVYGLGYPGQGAYITCFRYGEYIGNNSIWYYHRNRTTGVVGYSHSSYLNFNSGTVPRC
jgi:hypothetical protein